MTNKYTGSVLDVLKSKRFISSLVIVGLTLLSAIIPELEEHFDKISALATAAIIALVSGYSLQDVVIAIMTGGQIPSPEPPVIGSITAPDATDDDKQAFIDNHDASASTEQQNLETSKTNIRNRQSNLATHAMFFDYLSDWLDLADRNLEDAPTRFASLATLLEDTTKTSAGDKAILPMLIAFSKKIHDESLSTWQDMKRANGELLLTDMANSTFSADGNIKAEASQNALKTATIAQNLSDKPLNIKPRGDSLFLESNNSDDDDLADAEPLGIAS